MKGAPIRFLAGVVGGWIGIRILVLLPGSAPLELAREVLTPRATAMERMQLSRIVVPVPIPSPARRASVPRPRDVSTVGRVAPVLADPGHAQREAPAAENAAVLPAVIVPATLGPLPAATALRRRLSVSTWLLARGGAGGTLSGGRLGASQTGARVTYAIDHRRQVLLSARIAAPLRGHGAEAAIGVDWQPTRAPVHILAEQRLGLDGAEGGPTVMAIAGLNPTPVAAGFRLEAYAQGGAIWRSGRAEAFGDGAARLTHAVVSVGDATLDAGVGSWAAGQRGAARVDVGPTIGLVLPVAGRRVRVSADWRQRVAGHARPGSGPALSVGTDF